MKTTIITLVSILLIMPSIAQEAFTPRWNCSENVGRPGDVGVGGFTCYPVCTEAEDEPRPLETRQNRRNACTGPEYNPMDPFDDFRCAEAQGEPICSVSSSGGGGGTSNADKALIAGGVAIAAVAAYNILSPDLPEGVNLRPVANLAYRDGLAVTTAGLRAEWRNLQFSAISTTAGEGWTKPYARVQWAWVF